MKLWKSMKGTAGAPRSQNGDEGAWKLLEWRRHEGKLEMCWAGYHASRNVIDAMRYVDAELLAQVEVKGKHIDQDDKQCWSEMRILKAWPWTKEDNVSLAIYAAGLVIPIFEKQYPGDNRPRSAIEAAKAWLIDPTEKNRLAARAASDAAWAASWAAGAAADAAGAASWAAWAASDAARAAVWASDAARAAGVAAPAARIKTRCHRFVLARLKRKEEK